MWSFTLCVLALAGFLATFELCVFTLPYLFVGAFQYPFLGFEITPLFAFVGLFTFRYLRLMVNMVGYLMYRPAPRSADPRYCNRDVTVICPTIEPEGDIFRRCLESVCLQEPAAFYIVVGRAELLGKAEAICAGLRLRYPSVRIEVHASLVPGKRVQVSHVIPRISTAITMSIDDHVFWPTSNPGSFLASVLAAFEDDNVYLVGTNKRVIVEPNLSLWKSFWNFIGIVYLERHNFEIMSSTWIDGGVFAVSGRTNAIRSEVLHNKEFRNRYLNETFGFLWFLWGPLGADDDNMVTRWVYEKGYEVRIQAEDDSCIETTLGWFPKHLSTSVRWARTTFRSNPRSLLMGNTWRRQPWSIYAVYISGMLNFALIFDPLLCWLYQQSTICSGWHGIWVIICWIMFTKSVKLWPHFFNHPRHILFFPGYILFAFFHSIIKFFALITFNDVAWSGRKKSEIYGGPKETDPLIGGK